MLHSFRGSPRLTTVTNRHRVTTRTTNRHRANALRQTRLRLTLPRIVLQTSVSIVEALHQGARYVFRQCGHPWTAYNVPPSLHVLRRARQSRGRRRPPGAAFGNTFDKRLSQCRRPIGRRAVFTLSESGWEGVMGLSGRFGQSLRSRC